MLMNPPSRPSLEFYVVLAALANGHPQCPGTQLSEIRKYQRYADPFYP